MELKNLIHPFRMIALLIALCLLATITWQQRQFTRMVDFEKNTLLKSVSQALSESTMYTVEKLIAEQDQLKLQRMADRLAEHPVVLDIRFYDTEANLIAENHSAQLLQQHLSTGSAIVQTRQVYYENEHQGFVSISLDYSEIAAQQQEIEEQRQQTGLLLVIGAGLMGFFFAQAIPFRKITHQLRQTLYNRGRKTIAKPR